MAIVSKNNSFLSQLLNRDSNSVGFIKAGDLVEAKLMQRGQRAAYFDLGQFGTGIVYGMEFINAQDILKGLKIGDSISAKVVDMENEDGYIELSLREVGKQKIWQGIKEIQDKGEVLTVKIAAANTGGLMAEINGVKAFLPVSQLTGEHYPRVDDGDKAKILEELKKLVGQEMKVKIIDVNSRTNKLIISEKEIASENVKELVTKYNVGDVVDGVISGVADFGAFFKFTDNPSIEGLIHISELDHRLIENPKEVVKIGDAVKAKITEIKDGRVSLSLKALKPNPWDEVDKKYKAGDVINGVITRFNPFGAFVALDPDIQGLIHVSEFGSVDEMKKVLEVGKAYPFRIDSLKPQEKRIVLKLNK